MMLKRKPLSAMTQQDAWTAVRRLVSDGQPITGPSIGEIVSHQIQPRTPHRLREWLRAWVAGGALADAPGQPGVYVMVADPGPEAPRYRRDGSAITSGRAQERMWAVMRVLNSGFTPLDLAVHASVEDQPVTEDHAAVYCRALARVGILSRTRDGAYALLPGAWTGPLYPQCQAGGAVRDRNRDRLLIPTNRLGGRP